MKILITGINGQLGHDAAEEAKRRGHIVYGTGTTSEYSGSARLMCELDGYIRMDITDDASVSEVMDAIKPDGVIHCAAWTAVDKAEDEECRDMAVKVNADGTANIAKACKRINAKLIYISTDYVFDGEGTKAWGPDETDYRPVNQYGLSKLMGEKAVAENLEKFFIVRISWVYGINGNNFVRTMMKLSESHDALRVVNDQIGLPTYTRDLASLLMDMIQTKCYGYYHACNSGEYISWYQFACEIFKMTGADVNVIPVTTEEYGLSKARRPKNSRLDTGKLKKAGFSELAEWKDALGRFLKEVQ